jgi:hypothetical protein
VGHHPGSDIRISLTADVKPAVPNKTTIGLDFTFHSRRTVLVYFDKSSTYFFYTCTLFTADHLTICIFRTCQA